MTKALPIARAEQLLVTMTKNAGVDFDRADPARVWACFKQFCAVPVLCVDENILFQCGTHKFGGTPKFYFGFMRHFVLESVSDFDGQPFRYRENIQADVIMPPMKELESIRVQLWASDVGETSAFLDRVESSGEFKTVIANSQYGKLEIFRGG